MKIYFVFLFINLCFFKNYESFLKIAPPRMLAQGLFSSHSIFRNKFIPKKTNKFSRFNSFTRKLDAEFPNNQSQEQEIQEQENVSNNSQENENENLENGQENENLNSQEKEISQQKNTEKDQENQEQSQEQKLDINEEKNSKEQKKEEEKIVVKSPEELGFQDDSKMFSEELKNRLQQSNIRNPIIIVNDPIPDYDPEQQNVDKIANLDETFHHDYVKINQEQKFVDGEIFDQQGQLKVNATPEQVTELHEHQQQDFKNYLSQYKTISYKFENGQLVKTSEIKTNDVTMNDIEYLSSLLSTINELFEYYYSLVPTNDELIQNQQENDQDKLEEEKEDVWDKTLKALKFYQKIKNFVVTIIEKRQELIEDIIILKQKLKFLKTTEEDMLKFYDLDQQYYKIKMQASKYEFKDEKFVIYYQNIHLMNDNFNSDVQNLSRECFDIFQFHDFFEEAIDQIYEVTKVTNVMQVLKTVDQILMLTLRMLEFKLSINVMVQNAKDSLLNLKDYKIKINTELRKIEKLSSYYENGLDQVEQKEEENDKKKFSFKIICSFILMILYVQIIYEKLIYQLNSCFFISFKSSFYFMDILSNQFLIFYNSSLDLFLSPQIIKKSISASNQPFSSPNNFPYSKNFQYSSQSIMPSIFLRRNNSSQIQIFSNFLVSLSVKF